MQEKPLSAATIQVLVNILNADRLNLLTELIQAREEIDTLRQQIAKLESGNGDH